MTPQNVGNWVSKELIKNGLAPMQVKAIPVSRLDPPLNTANQVLAQNKVLVAVGFDVLQIPR